MIKGYMRLETMVCLAETLLDIGFHTLSLINSTYPSAIWDKLLANNSVFGINRETWNLQLLSFQMTMLMMTQLRLQNLNSHLEEENTVFD
jgi:hypothetical protein